jgi:hypothetical protein
LVTKEEAVQRLINAGFTQEADDLVNWRDLNGKNWGWDGWIRGTHPHVVPVVWPDE